MTDAPDQTDEGPRPATSLKRALLLGAAIITIVAGLTVHWSVAAAWANPVTNALYTVLVALLLAFAAPRRPLWQIALGAFGFSAAIECFQATGVPAALADQWPPSALVLGTTFIPTDFISYALGAAAFLFLSLAMSLVIRWVRNDILERRARADRAARRRSDSGPA
ncbi:DUF2809 domain-containing protein [Plantibacter sp. VKM Ac-2885]|uniref:ribosomal maturation YjgA family protein n=1 Tax=unclassified Plantibacter TaxID=2624265 RepID=UPI000F5EBF6D|nr:MULTISPECIES: DUF2809 domain-containing protein [unclassified Plantibacter]AZH82062.1 DUF2809 domain-containing protein [Plantibacter sp. PA-3-X8]MBD8100919.1 DUF2809 domain-containing protein [Plantibacter sp. CFBP 8775]MBD8533565.1 DUF2809 domain-containing protein [Plantibacter sp. CFBP 13570]MBF4510965.1 DUF2809 domain-containing protein [Plantibacter sp. VKM Ac-2885]